MGCFERGGCLMSDKAMLDRLKSMEIVQVPIDQIKPYENNPRKNSKAVQPVANSIEEFGFNVPMVLTADYTIITGHTRYEAAKLLGMEEVPCIIASHLNDEGARGYRLSDNKVSEFATWDFTKLEEELAKLSDFDMTAFGFDGDWDVDLDDFFEDKDEDAKEPEEKEPQRIQCPHCGEWIEI